MNLEAIARAATRLYDCPLCQRTKGTPCALDRETRRFLGADRPGLAHGERVNLLTNTELSDAQGSNDGW